MFYVIFSVAVVILAYNLIMMIKHKASMHKNSKSAQNAMFKAQKEAFENLENRD